MHLMPFFFGKGLLRIWYILFYILGLPCYLLGLLFFSQIKPGIGPQGELIFTILAIGYLLLGVFSMINTLIYIHKTHHYLKPIILFFGMQVSFWYIGYLLGNNYLLLFFLFLSFLLLTIYLNLLALWKSYRKDIKK